MKNSIKTLATLLVATTLAFVGCKKENITPDTPDTPEEEIPENIYVGTSWTAHLENTFYEQYQGYNFQFDVTYDLILDFLDSTHAELFHDIYLSVRDFPEASQSMNETDECTYTFTADSVCLYATYYDEETGDTDVYTYELVYDKEANTLTLDFSNDDMREIMGTTVVVFTPMESSSKTIVPRPQNNSGKTNWHNVLGKIIQAIER